MHGRQKCCACTCLHGGTTACQSAVPASSQDRQPGLAFVLMLPVNPQSRLHKAEHWRQSAQGAHTFLSACRRMSALMATPAVLPFGAFGMLAISAAVPATKGTAAEVPLMRA